MTLRLRLGIIALIACAFVVVVPAQTSVPPPPAQAPTPTPNPTPVVRSQAKANPTPKPVALAGESISEARDLLGALGYWVDFAEERKTGRLEQNQSFDASMRHALIAFQKINQRQLTGVLTVEELVALRAAKRPEALESGYAHLEIDLTKQVLLVVDSCGACVRILPVSTGSGKLFTEGGRTRRATTPLGRFNVERKIAGWRKSALGLLYYPSYVVGGVAIHGNPLVPPQPASHGCIRIPMYAAKRLYDIAVIGMPVIIYASKPAGEKPLLTAQR